MDGQQFLAIGASANATLGVLIFKIKAVDIIESGQCGKVILEWD